MKKLAATAALAAVLCTAANVYAEDISVSVNGNAVNFDVPPMIINDRTMVPMRAIFEALGAGVDWDDASKTAVSERGGVSVSVTIGESALKRNGESIALDSPAVIVDGRTLVPVRAISEAFGCGVEWDGGSRSVIITDGSYSGTYNGSGSTTIYDIPPYSGMPYAAVNLNVPYFTPYEVTTAAYESYSDLDYLGRCGAASACLGVETMPTEKRGAIGSVRPSGWQTIRYDFISGLYLYNRCHLIGYQLSGENANEKNLITGTRYLNVEGMLPFEDETAEYIKSTGNHVMYRVTPMYTGENLVADGVLMEGLSAEDGGSGLQFCVFCYNVQPGVSIDYATGESYATGEITAPEQEDIHAPSEPEVISEPVYTGTYIINTNTGVFHYEDCGSVKKMSEKNKQEFTGSRDELVAEGYRPCSICQP